MKSSTPRGASGEVRADRRRIRAEVEHTSHALDDPNEAADADRADADEEQPFVVRMPYLENAGGSLDVDRAGRECSQVALMSGFQRTDLGLVADRRSRTLGTLPFPYETPRFYGRKPTCRSRTKPTSSAQLLQ